MKRLLVLLSLFVATSGAYAFDGDGSPPNNYIYGRSNNMQVSNFDKNLPDDFYRGDGSISNSYIHGKSPNIKKETKSLPQIGQGFMGDGSPKYES